MKSCFASARTMGAVRRFNDTGFMCFTAYLLGCHPAPNKVLAARPTLFVLLCAAALTEQATIASSVYSLPESEILQTWDEE